MICKSVCRKNCQKITTINSLAQSIAQVNDQISQTKGSPQDPNDLLDRRDQLIKELNQYVQTTSVKADDGSVSIYIAGSQELVLGNTASKVALVNDDFGDSRSSKLAIMRAGTPLQLDENALGGGRFRGCCGFRTRTSMKPATCLGASRWR